MINVSEAKKIYENSYLNVDEEEVAGVFKKIQKAAESGAERVSVGMSREIAPLLRSNGYAIEDSSMFVMGKPIFIISGWAE